MNERLRVAENMHKYGGHFIAALAHALYNADADNTAKIKATWPDEWAKYAKIEEAQNGESIETV